MRYAQKWSPIALAGIVGQTRTINAMRRFIANPDPRCFLFEGPGGIGKSATAGIVADALGVAEYNGLHRYSGPQLSIEVVRELFTRTFRMKPMFGATWHVLLIEELEMLPSRNVAPTLKDELSEEKHPPRLIVIAASNDASELDESLLQRFKIYPFSAGEDFAHNCEDHLQTLWRYEHGNGAPMPSGVMDAGWQGTHFSMRLALNALEEEVAARQPMPQYEEAVA